MEHVIYVFGAGGFYSGKTYIHQGETFPAVTNESSAKRYTSRKRAENAVKVLNRKCSDDFEIREIKYNEQTVKARA